jgi:hypothetical protein
VRVVRSARVVTARPGLRAANGAGRARARRVFVLFAAGLALIYGFLLGSAAASPLGAQAALGVLLVLGALAVPLAAAGALLTLGRAPREAWVEGDRLCVREWTGRVRDFGLSSGLRIRTVERHGRGPLAPQATELDEVASGAGRRRVYLVADGFFEFVGGASGA